MKIGLDKLTNVIIPLRLTQTPGPDIIQTREREKWKSHFHIECSQLVILSSSGPGPGPRSGPGQVPGQVQKVQGLRAKDLDLG